MIFAKLDVCVWNHKRFVRAGPAACGLWMAALAYLRDDESSDGILTTDALGLLLGLGRTKAAKLAWILVEAGLFAEHQHGFVLLRYEEKNETREDIRQRRQDAKEKKAAQRAGSSSRHLSPGDRLSLSPPLSPLPSRHASTGTAKGTALGLRARSRESESEPEVKPARSQDRGDLEKTSDTSLDAALAPNGARLPPSERQSEEQDRFEAARQEQLRRAAEFELEEQQRRDREETAT